MSFVLCDDSYIWALCTSSTLAVISQVNGPEEDLPARLWEKAADAGKQSHRTGSPDDLDQAIILGALALKYLEKANAQAKFNQYAFDWCYRLERKWLATKDENDRAHLTTGWTKFLEIGSSLYPDWYRSLDTEIVQSRHDYQKVPSDENWKKCQLVAEVLVSATHGRREEAYATSQLGILAYGRGNRTSHVMTRKAMFEESLRHQEEAVSLLRADESINHGIYYGHIAYSHGMLWEIEQMKISDRLRHCNAAIEVFEKTILLLGSENKAWVGCSDRLARLYWARWSENHDNGDIESGVRVFESILEVHPNNPHAQSGLAELLRQRADNMVMSHAQRIKEADRSLQLLENVIVQTADSDGALPSRLGKCSGVLADRFGHGGAMQDIELAIELQKTAIALPQVLQGSLWFHYAQLSAYWQKRFHHTRIPEDLKLGEEAARESIKAAGRTTACRVRGITELAVSQCVSYQFGVVKTDEIIDEAISNLREAMKLQPDWRSVTLLRNLGAALMIKFDRGGSYDLASEGITYLRQAVDILRQLSGKGGSEDEAFVTSLLAKALRERHRKFSGKEDLDEAIRLFRHVVQLNDEEDVKSVGYIRDFCFSLGLRGEMTRSQADIREAQQRLETAISYLSKDASPSQRYGLENALGQAFLRGYNVTEDITHFKAAVEHFEVCLEPSSSPLDDFASEMRQLAKDSLSQAYCARAVATKALGDYLTAMQFYSRLMTDSMKSDTKMESYVYEGMAEVALSLWRHGGGPNSKSKEVRYAGTIAQQAFCNVLSQGQTTPLTKTNTAAETAQLFYLLDKDTENAKNYSKMALENLLDSAMLGLNRLDFLRIVRLFPHLPSMNLCYSILGNEAPEKALQEFEKARTLIWNRQLNDRNPVNDLEVCHADLAQRFEKLQIRLAATREPLSRLDTDRMNYTAPDYHKISFEHNEVLGQIRKQNGFEDFLLTPGDVRNVQDLASDGPIVVVNLTPWYSHAILIQNTGIRNIELPVRDHNGKDYHEGFEVALQKVSQNLHEATNVLGQVMQVLWDGIAKPILDALGFEKPSNGEPLPRMWWVTTGWLNVLPIHLAASFSDVPGGTIADSLMDHVVSSYVPNLRALKFARTMRDAMPNNVQSPQIREALFVQMPETPGHDPLPNAEKEVDEAISIVEKFYTCIKSDRPTRKQVLHQLEQASMTHFVCHGIADNDDPTKSRLLLSDHVKSPFDVRACHKAKLDKCRLAYLSACETAMTKDLALKEEGIHIADAILLAGVPHVIATWWRVVDEESVSLATGFYGNLIDEQGVFDPKRSARAIHAAAKGLRDRGSNPFIWGAYVYFGA